MKLRNRRRAMFNMHIHKGFNTKNIHIFVIKLISAALFEYIFYLIHTLNLHLHVHLLIRCFYQVTPFCVFMYYFSEHIYDERHFTCVATFIKQTLLKPESTGPSNQDSSLYRSSGSSTGLKWGFKLSAISWLPEITNKATWNMNCPMLQALPVNCR